MEKDQTVISVIWSVTAGVLILFLLFFLVLRALPQKWFEHSCGTNGLRYLLTDLLRYFRCLSLLKVLTIFILSFSAHFFDILGSFYLSRAINIDQHFPIFLLIMPIVYVFTILPISIGGIGVREGVLSFFLVKVGVYASDAVLLALIIYLNRVVVGAVGGVIQFIEKRSLSTEII